MDTTDHKLLLSCLHSEDSEALSYYLAGVPRNEDLTEFFCCDGNAIINVVENVVPTHLTPLPADVIGTLVLGPYESVEQANRRHIKLVSILEDHDKPREIQFTDGEYKYAFVKVRAGTPCYRCAGQDDDWFGQVTTLPGHVFVTGDVEEIKIE